MNSDDHWICWGSINYNEGFGFFSIWICDHEFVTEIRECESTWSIESTEEESNVSGSAELVSLDHSVDILEYLGIYNYMVIGMIFKA